MRMMEQRVVSAMGLLLLLGVNESRGYVTTATTSVHHHPSSHVARSATAWNLAAAANSDEEEEEEEEEDKSSSLSSSSSSPSDLWDPVQRQMAILGLVVCLSSASAATTLAPEPAWAASIQPSPGSVVTASKKAPAAAAEPAVPAEKKQLDAARALFQEQKIKLSALNKEFDAAKTELTANTKAVQKYETAAPRLTQILTGEQEKLNVVIKSADKRAIIDQKLKVDQAKAAALDNTDSFKQSKAAESKAKSKIDSLRKTIQQAEKIKSKASDDASKFEKKYKQYLETTKKQQQEANKKAEQARKQQAEREKRAAEEARKKRAEAEKNARVAAEQEREMARKKAAAEKEALSKRRKQEAEQARIAAQKAAELKAKQIATLKSKLEQASIQMGDLIIKGAPDSRIDPLEAKIEAMKQELKALSATTVKK